VGRELLRGLPRGEKQRLARSLCRTTRTLRNWMKLAAEHDAGYRPPGRPRRPVEQHAAARVRVAAVLERVGYAVGERTVHRLLGEDVSLGLVRAVLRELKAEHRGRARGVRQALRTHVEVHGRNVLWSVDATHLGRDAGGGAVLGEIVRDVASTASLGLSVGPPPTSGEVVVLLDRVVRETGETPLVLSTDNGPENKGAVHGWCKRHGVVHLWNLPHTPQHNPWVEHGNRELKAESGLGKGVAIDSPMSAAGALIDAVERIDCHRPRATRGWQTAHQAYAALPPADNLCDRQRLVLAVTCAIDEALQDCTSPRERRLAERQAILRTMERFDLITRTRGCTPNKPEKPEGVS